MHKMFSKKHISKMKNLILDIFSRKKTIQKLTTINGPHERKDELFWPCKKPNNVM